MKRAGKCVGKKSFAYRHEAEAQVIRNFVFGKKTYGIYECPTCLDFHTTSTRDNRSYSLRLMCTFIKSRYYKKKQALGHEAASVWLYRKLNSEARPRVQKKIKPIKRKPVDEIMAHAYRLMREHLGLQAPKHTTLKGQLPLTEQRRLLQELTKQQSTGVV